MNYAILAFIIIAGMNFSCAKNEIEKTDKQIENQVGIRPMNKQESMNDFQELVSLFRNFYGPLEYKERTFNFKFEDHVKNYTEKVSAAKSDTELFGYYAEFVSKFQDGHVGIRFPLNDTGFYTYEIPLIVSPVAGKVLLTQIEKELPSDARYEIGDEIIAIDGQPTMSYLPTILKYNVIATPESNEHWIFRIFKRDFYMVDLVPQNPTSLVRFKKPTGEEWTEEFIWRTKQTVNKQTDFVNEKAADASKRFFVEKSKDASVLNWGKSTPFFATKEVEKEIKWLKVEANEVYREKYKLKKEEKPDIFAAIYNYKGKNILLVRNYTYSHVDFRNSVYMNGYRAILDQWQAFADVLVVDQTHNTGGSYCEDFTRLFLQKEGSGFVQALNVDRKWIWDLQNDWVSDIFESNKSTVPTNEVLINRLMAKTVEDAYDDGNVVLTTPQAIMGGSRRIQPDSQFVWRKPMLVLIDELAGSCGDAFPMLIKNNRIAKLFGRRTMGLGGSVEMFTLQNSRTQVRLTRGLFTSHKESEVYTDQDWIENKGIVPDISYEHTVEDTRNGFVEYVKTFSNEAVNQIKE